MSLNLAMPQHHKLVATTQWVLNPTSKQDTLPTSLQPTGHLLNTQPQQMLFSSLEQCLIPRKLPSLAHPPLHRPLTTKLLEVSFRKIVNILYNYKNIVNFLGTQITGE
jgi:hypothetical protein